MEHMESRILKPKRLQIHPRPSDKPYLPTMMVLRADIPMMVLRADILMLITLSLMEP